MRDFKPNKETRMKHIMEVEVRKFEKGYNVGLGWNEDIFWLVDDPKIGLIPPGEIITKREKASVGRAGKWTTEEKEVEYVVLEKDLYGIVEFNATGALTHEISNAGLEFLLEENEAFLVEIVLDHINKETKDLDNVSSFWKKSILLLWDVVYEEHYIYEYACYEYDVYFELLGVIEQHHLNKIFS